VFQVFDIRKYFTSFQRKFVIKVFYEFSKKNLKENYSETSFIQTVHEKFNYKFIR
jgi:hypothetical protein